MPNKVEPPQIETINESRLTIKGEPRLEWVWVEDAAGWLWSDNPKLHDAGAIADSIAQYGFQDRPVFDINLRRVGQSETDEALGAIKSGNGRLEALGWMERQGRDLPDYMAQDKETGRWAVQVLFGTDAKSAEMAQAYAIDANNTPLMGADGITTWEMSRMWDEEGYLKVLKGLAEANVMPVSVDGEDLSDLLAALPENVVFPEYDESVADEIEYLECPECGHKWPK